MVGRERPPPRLSTHAQSRDQTHSPSRSPHFPLHPPSVSANLIAKEDIVSLERGCVCCSLRSDLVEALKELERRAGASGQPFDAVLLETTGVADPGPVVSAERRESGETAALAPPRPALACSRSASPLLSF